MKTRIVPDRREFLFSLAAAGSLAGAVPGDGFTDLFEAKQGGYALYRIPGIVVTKKGTVLVYAEARRHTGSDWDDIDLLLRRSTDGGQTFSAPMAMPHIPGLVRNPVAVEHRIGQTEWRTYDNPVAIAGRDGRVHFVFCAEYMRVFHCVSMDDARTFSPPVEITAALEPLRSQYAWRVVATGPGHGIELKSGRLVIPVWVALGQTGNGHGPSCNSTLYSDDHGRSWYCGEIAVPDTEQFPSANETAIVECADGSVTINVRTASPRNLRTISHSRDGATHWSAPQRDDALVDPVCAAGLYRVPVKKGPPLWFFSNPDNLTRADGKDQAGKDRRNLTLRMSADEGGSWKTVRVLEPGMSGYSDLSSIQDRTLLCFYEGRNADNQAVLRLRRLAIADLIRA